MAALFYEQALPVNLLIYYGIWLLEPIDCNYDLSKSCSTAQFQRWARSTLNAAGHRINRFGAHSMRRGSAAELVHGSISEPH